jgi:S-(hydroxymethyl)mycothiol dehydrogenase
MKVSAVVVRGPGAPVAVEEVELDPPGPGEVLVRVVASGVCHSDLHCAKGAFGTEFPYLLGHEATGIVEELGAGVDGPAVGDTVILNWRAPCGTCRWCIAGDASRCKKPLEAAPRMRTSDGKSLSRVLGLGTFASHTVVHAGQALPIDHRGLKPEATCLIGCAVATGVGAAMRTARVPPGSTVAVFGCGAVGTSVILGARASHASRIIAVDLVPQKLERARSLGATDAVDARNGDAGKQVRALTRGGVGYAFEAVGLPDTLQQALAATEIGGVCTMIGVPHPKAEITLPMARFFFSRVSLLPSHYGDCVPTRDFPVYADLYRRGVLPLEELVSETISLDQVPAAFARMERGEILRSVIVF